MNQPQEQAKVAQNVRPKRSTKGRSSFTLIELISVVAIIIVLTGIALKVTVYVQRKTGLVQTQRIIEQIKNALNEYYTVYGSFPPGTYEKGTNVLSIVAVTTNFLAVPENGYGYHRGLIGYLWKEYNPDPEVDRWQHYLDGIQPQKDPMPMAGRGGNDYMKWTNAIVRVMDGWGSDLLYECMPPFQAYRLWSIGPNYKDDNGEVDDVGVKWTE